MGTLKTGTVPCKSISTGLGKKCVPLVYPRAHSRSQVSWGCHQGYLSSSALFPDFLLRFYRIDLCESPLQYLSHSSLWLFQSPSAAPPPAPHVLGCLGRRSLHPGGPGPPGPPELGPPAHPACGHPAPLAPGPPAPRRPAGPPLRRGG